MDIIERTIKPEATMLAALKQMDAIDKKLLIIVLSEKFAGLVSAGDIQRAIIKNISLETPVIEIVRKNIRVAKPGDSFEFIKHMMVEFRMELCPVVSDTMEILKVYFWEEVFFNTKPKPAIQFNLPVVIMAGGFGSRLKPLTNVLPKPLIPIGEKTIIEEIFKRFENHGCNTFYVSVNYKAELIEFYLKNQHLPYELQFFKEEKPMGTVGSLALLKDKINQTFFISNCDVLIEQDYSEILQYHNDRQNEITIVAALKNYPIPYGTIESGEDGQLISLVEKPEMTFKINSGMYILEPNLIKEIPENTFFHITELIELVKKRNGKIGVFPVSEKSWKDIGEWNLYMKEI